MAYTNVKVPEGGAKISIQDGKLQVPDNPVIPFVEGDGTGRDIWRASVRVFDAAVEKAYSGKRRIHWMEVYAGEKSFKQFKSMHRESRHRTPPSRRCQSSLETWRRPSCAGPDRSLPPSRETIRSIPGERAAWPCRIVRPSG